jgi:hypothetical protein
MVKTTRDEYEQRSEEAREGQEARQRRIKREELELAKLEQDVKRGDLEIKLLLQEKKAKHMKNLKDALELMDNISPNWVNKEDHGYELSVGQSLRDFLEDIIFDVILK